MIAVPVKLVDRATRWHGSEGRAWTDRLPGLVTELARRWTLTLETPLPVGEELALIMAVRVDDRRPATLKVCHPSEDSRAEAAALRLWAGDGAVRLLDADTANGALLLERLVPDRSLRTLNDTTALPIACSLLRRLWQPPPKHHCFTLTSHEARHWSTNLRERYHKLGQPCEGSLLNAAEEALADLSATATTGVVLHGDFHRGNLLAADRVPWLAIDPCPRVGDPEFDAADLLADFLDIHIGEPDCATRLDALLTRLTEELTLDRERLRRWLLGKRIVLALGNIVAAGDGRWDLDFARVISHQY